MARYNYTPFSRPRQPQPQAAAAVPAGYAPPATAPQAYAGAGWVSNHAFSVGTTGNLARPIEHRDGTGNQAVPAGYAPPATPDVGAGRIARYDPYAPSDNFAASVHANNADARARQDVMAAGYAPAVPLANPDGTAKMGTASVTLGNGETVTRQYQQTADAPQTLIARREAGAAGHAAAGASRADYFAGVAADRRQAADLADPAGAEKRAHADLYRDQAYAAHAGGDNTYAMIPTKQHEGAAHAHQMASTGRLNDVNAGLRPGEAAASNALKGSQAGLNAANAGHVDAMTPVDVARGTAQAGLYRSQGAAADAGAGLTKERTATEVATRQPTVAKLGAEADLAHARAANPNPGQANAQYAAQRQHVGDQIARVRQQLAAATTKEAKAPLQQQLDALLYQQQQFSGQHADAVVPAPAPQQGYAPPPPPSAGAAAHPNPAPAGYGFAPAVAPPPAPAAAAAPVAPQTFHVPRLNRAVSMQELTDTAAKYGMTVDQVKAQLGIQ